MNSGALEVGDLIRSLNNGRIGVVKSVFWSELEIDRAMHGPYLVVIWIDSARESCWIPENNFVILSKCEK